MLTPGSLALNTATFIYMINWLPQLWRTLQRHIVEDLSQLMIFLVVIGWSSDLLYGRAYHMPGQYIFVSFLGCIQTTVWLYILAQKQFLSYLTLSGYLLLMICISVYPETQLDLVKSLPILTVAQSAFWVAMVAQVYKTVKLGSAQDISLLTYAVNTLGCLCSVVAAYDLGWQRQYLINVICMTLFHLVVLSILAFYRVKKYK